MKHRIQYALSFLALSSLATAQDIPFDGMMNSPLGANTTLSEVGGMLQVDNLGSSGQDGVRVNLGGSQGGGIAPIMNLAPGDVCTIGGDLGQSTGGPTSHVSLTMLVGQGETDLRPDFSSLGQFTYGLRLINDGQVVYDQGGHSGGTRMSNVPIVLPEKVYLFLPDWVGGPNYPAFCGFVDNGTVTPPGSGTGFTADVIEFYATPTDVDQVLNLDVQVAGPSQFMVQTEDMRFFERWVQGIDEALVEPQAGGKLKVSNLGSSGCDGVSISLGGGENELHGELEELAAPDHAGTSVWLEAETAGGEVEHVLAEEVGGQWLFTPDFSQFGAQTYTLELYEQGQLLFSQSGMSGPAVSAGVWALFYKKKTTHADGSTTTEWCIGGGASTAHTVAGGPTLIADMFTVRSESLSVQDASTGTFRARSAQTMGDITLNAFSTGSPSSCLGTSYCVAAPNSVGPGALMCSSGSTSIAANDLVLHCSGTPTNQFGLFFYGQNQIQAAFGNGFRCIGGSVYRLPILNSGAAGTFTYAVDNTAPPQASGQLSAGQQWHFQCWYRDPAAGGAAFNLSDGHTLQFLP